MLLLRFPNEIIIQVANELDPKSFNCLLRTSQFFAELLTPVLHSIALEDKDGNLFWASRRGHKPLARLLLERGTDPNVRSLDQKTPLHEAAEHGHENVASLLIATGAEVSVIDSTLTTPLHLAAGSGHVGMVRLLLGHGAAKDVNEKMMYGMTPLHWAVQGMEVVYARLLEKANPGCSWESYWDHEGRIEAFFDEGYLDEFREEAVGRLAGVTRVLLENGAIPDIWDDSDQTVLHVVASEERFDADIAAGLLLDSGAKVNAQNRVRKTPLHLAARNGLLKVARVLLDRGANVNAWDSGGRIPVNLATSPEMVELLTGKSASSGAGGPT